MPIYEYSCPTCEHKFDQLVKMGTPDPECPKCGAQTRKLVSAAGFILKGGGWYKDHYGLKKGSSESSGDAGKASDSGSKTGGDSAPAAAATPSASTSGGSGSTGGSGGGSTGSAAST